MIIFKGSKRPTKVRTEQVRAFLYATLAVLGYHHRFAKLPIVVSFKKEIVYQGVNCDGLYHNGHIELRSDMNHEDMLTTCIHEVIHACMEFPVNTLEKNTSTLTAKLKPDVLRLSQILVENTYQRAAFLAHTKIHYMAKDGDHYDDNQNTPIGVIPYRKTDTI